MHPLQREYHDLHPLEKVLYCCGLAFALVLLTFVATRNFFAILVVLIPAAAASVAELLGKNPWGTLTWFLVAYGLAGILTLLLVALAFIF